MEENDFTLFQNNIMNDLNLFEDIKEDSNPPMEPSPQKFNQNNDIDNIGEALAASGRR